MSKNPRISLALLNRNGSIASLTDDDGMDAITLVSDGRKRNSYRICLEAAKVLRKLADDFDKLAVAEDPWKEKTQLAISKNATKEDRT